MLSSSSSSSSDGDEEDNTGGSGGRARSPPVVPPPGAQSCVEAAAPTSTAVAQPPPAAIAPALSEGPPWNLRLEEVRTAKGQLRFFRIIATASFTVLVSAHTGAMYSMQTRHTAVALVLTCPPSGYHYEFLLRHFDLCRGLLHRSLAFGMRASEKFFHQLFIAQARSAEGGPIRAGPQQQQRMMRNITALLEKDSLALETYASIKQELGNALSLRQPLPRLHPPLPCGGGGAGEAAQPRIPFRMATRGFTPPMVGPPPPPPMLRSSALLCSAIAELAAYAESFLTAVVAGLLSLNAAGGEGPASSRPASPHPMQHNAARQASAGYCGGFGAAAAASRAPHAHRDPCGEYWRALTKAAVVKNREGGAGDGCAPLACGHDVTGGAALRRRPAGDGLQPGSFSGAGGSITSAAAAAAVASSSATQLRRQSRAVLGARDEGRRLSIAVPPSAGSASPLSGAGSPTGAAGAKEGFVLSSRTKARVVIFSADAALAQRLMVVASFFFPAAAAGGTEDVLQHCVDGESEETAWLSAAQRIYPRAFAGATRDSAATGLPVQWVPVEFSDAELEKITSAAVYSPENTVLVISPRLLLCRRVRLFKTLETTTIAVQQQLPRGDGGVGAAAAPGRLAQTAKLFRCRVRSVENVAADDVIGALLREAVTLQQNSDGVVAMAPVLRDMVRWLAAREKAQLLQGDLDSTAAQVTTRGTRRSIGGGAHPPGGHSRAPSRGGSGIGGWMFPVSAPISLSMQTHLRSGSGGLASPTTPDEGSRTPPPLVDVLLPGSLPRASVANGASFATLHSPCAGLAGARGVVVPSSMLSGSFASGLPQGSSLNHSSTTTPHQPQQHRPGHSGGSRVSGGSLISRLFSGFSS